MALALYNFEAVLAENKVAGNEHINSLKQSGVNNVEQPDRRLKIMDINELTQNFILSKALCAFEHNGTIDRVRYEEEQEQYIQEANNSD